MEDAACTEYICAEKALRVRVKRERRLGLAASEVESVGVLRSEFSLAWSCSSARGSRRTQLILAHCTVGCC